MASFPLLLITATLVLCEVYGEYGVKEGEYDSNYGTYIGKITELHHDVTADIYAVDNITIFVRGFSYDGEAPDAFFFAGNRTPKPSNRGFVIANERGSMDPLGPYRNKNFILKFPETKKGQRGFEDTKWLSVWCRKFAIDFGHVVYPKDLHVPVPVDGGKLSSEDKSVSASSVMLETTEKIKVKSFSFDGFAEDAIFVMGVGLLEDADGHQVADETNSIDPIKKYKRKNLTLKIPHAASGQPIQYFGVWSPSHGMMAKVDFPQNMRIPPAHD